MLLCLISYQNVIYRYIINLVEPSYSIYKIYDLKKIMRWIYLFNFIIMVTQNIVHKSKCVHFTYLPISE